MLEEEKERLETLEITVEENMIFFLSKKKEKRVCLTLR
jgi:hypothetical protein